MTEEELDIFFRTAKENSERSFEILERLVLWGKTKSSSITPEYKTVETSKVCIRILSDLK